MEEFEKRLEKLKCPKKAQIIILKTITEIKNHQDKPKSKEVISEIQKELSKLMKNED